MFYDIPWIAVVIAVVFQMMLGMTWYSPNVFGTIWADSLGIKMDPRPGAWQFAGSFLTAAVIAITLAALSRKFNLVSLKEAACAGLLMWLALVATTHFSAVVWAGKSLRAYFIEVTYVLIAVVAILCFYAVWPY